MFFMYNFTTYHLEEKKRLNIIKTQQHLSKWHLVMLFYLLNYYAHHIIWFSCIHRYNAQVLYAAPAGRKFVSAITYVNITIWGGYIEVDEVYYSCNRTRKLLGFNYMWRNTIRVHYWNGLSTIVISAFWF